MPKPRAPFVGTCGEKCNSVVPLFIIKLNWIKLNTNLHTSLFKYFSLTSLVAENRHCEQTGLHIVDYQKRKLTVENNWNIKPFAWSWFYSHVYHKKLDSFFDLRTRSLSSFQIQLYSSSTSHTQQFEVFPCQMKICKLSKVFECGCLNLRLAYRFCCIFCQRGVT